MYSCCLKHQAPPNTQEKIYYPFDPYKFEFIAEPDADFTLVAFRTPVRNVNRFIYNLNTVMSSHRTRINRARFGILLLLVLLILAIIMTVTQKMLFYLAVTIICFIMIVLTSWSHTGLFKQITPKLLQFISYSGVTYRALGLEWSLGQIKEIPAWLELDVVPVNEAFVSNRDNFSPPPLIVQGQVNFKEFPIHTASISPTIRTSFEFQEVPYYGEESKPMVGEPVEYSILSPVGR